MECAVAALIVSTGLVRVLEGGLVESRVLCPAGSGASGCRRAAGHIPKGRRALFLQLMAWLLDNRQSKCCSRLSSKVG